MKKLGLWLVSVAMLCISAVAFANTDYLTQPTFDTAPLYDTVIFKADTADPASVAAQPDTVAIGAGSYDFSNRMYAYSELMPQSYVVTWSVCYDEPAIETPSKIPIAI